MLTQQDLKQLSQKGITQEKLESQLNSFKTGFPFLRLKGAAAVGNGIIAPDDEQHRKYVDAWNKYKAQGRVIVKFVPASGAASRMFKDMFAFLDAPYDVPTTDFEKEFFDNIKKFAFREALCDKCRANNGKSIKIEYVSSFFTMYYGELDSRGNRTGEGVQLVYAVNMKEQEKYAKVYLRGQFSNDMVNGEFTEYSYKIVEKEFTAHTSGKMVDNKYDGEIKSLYEETDARKDNYVFIFKEGLVQKLGRMVDIPGEYYAVAVDNTTEPGNPWYFAYTKEGLEKVRGFYPYYSMLY